MTQSTADREYAPDPENDIRDFTFHSADPSAATTLTPEQVEHYNEHGFVAPLRVFDDEDIGEIRAYFDNLLHQVVDADDRRNAYSINFYHLVCAGIYDLIHTPQILDLVQDIIGPDFICWGTQLFCKLPHNPMAVPLHQDATYWAFRETKSVSVWLAIDDVDEDNAAMEFVPESHRLGGLPHEVKPLDGTRVLKRQVTDPDRFDERYVNRLRAGEMSLHNDLLLHGSPPNPSDRRRAGFTIRYTAASVDVVPDGREVLRTVVHCRGDIPDRWPHRRRPDGDHPEKMAHYSGLFDGNEP